MAQDLNKFAERLAAGVREFVSRAMVPALDGIKALTERLDNLPQPQRGEKGDPGIAGDVGPAGADGKDGSTGRDGEPGEKGEPGEPGPPGQDGKDGAPGPAGRDGADGKDGLPGKDGAPGLNGKDGRDGIDGKDADEAAIVKAIEALLPGLIEKATEAAMQKAVSAIPVPKDGRDGTDGINGKDGASVDRSEVAAMVDETVRKAVADIPAPKDGRDGRDGEPGRDAVHVEVLDGIDPAKRYQRGTYAYFRGGKVRSFRATDPMPADGELEKHGWHVVGNGIAEIAIEHGDDLRSIALGIRSTDGAVTAKTITLPVAIYRGIWREGDAYTKGDQATRDGSTWTLMTDAQTGKPGEEGSGWALSTKRGRDGRDGLKGEKGDRGAEGKMGPSGIR